MIRKVFGWAVAAFAFYYLVKDPAGAVRLVDAGFAAFQHAASALASALSHRH